MNVLHVVAGNLFGGVETLFVTLARCRHVCPEMEPHFAVCYDGRLSRELDEAGVPVHRLGPVRISRPWTVWKARAALRRVIARHGPDRLICHSSWPHAVFGPVARRAGVPLIQWVHGPVNGRSWLDRLAQRTPPDLVISNSRFTERQARRLFPNAPGRCLYYPVEMDTQPQDPDTAAARRRALDTPPNAVVIIQVSRMERWKGHELHLRALARVPKDLNWRCWMVGGAQRPDEAVYRQSLERLAADLHLSDRVTFLGERRDVPDLLRAADIHCQPNLGPEPFGITFIEALARGLPMVTTALGGAEEIVDDNCGRLVPPGDEAGLARALTDLVADPDLRRRLGEAAPARARQLCDPQAQVGALFGTLVPVARRGAA
jgi:glycosyltransferase involved in cell wall biosynthesis